MAVAKKPTTTKKAAVKNDAEVEKVVEKKEEAQAVETPAEKKEFKPKVY